MCADVNGGYDRDSVSVCLTISRDRHKSDSRMVLIKMYIFEYIERSLIAPSGGGGAATVQLHRGRKEGQLTSEVQPLDQQHSAHISGIREYYLHSSCSRSYLCSREWVVIMIINYAARIHSFTHALIDLIPVHGQLD